MVARDLAYQVIGLNTQCLWVTPTPIPGLHSRRGGSEKDYQIMKAYPTYIFPKFPQFETVQIQTLHATILSYLLSMGTLSCCSSKNTKYTPEIPEFQKLR